MATTSFNKDFIIDDEKNVKSFQAKLANPKKVKIISRDLKAEKVKGVQLLKRRLSVLETC